MSRAQRSPSEVTDDVWRTLERRARYLGVEFRRGESGAATIRHAGRLWHATDPVTAEAALRCCKRTAPADAVEARGAGA